MRDPLTVAALKSPEGTCSSHRGLPRVPSTKRGAYPENSRPNGRLTPRTVDQPRGLAREQSTKRGAYPENSRPDEGVTPSTVDHTDPEYSRPNLPRIQSTKLTPRTVDQPVRGGGGLPGIAPNIACTTAKNENWREMTQLSISENPLDRSVLW